MALSINPQLIDIVAKKIEDTSRAIAREKRITIVLGSGTVIAFGSFLLNDIEGVRAYSIAIYGGIIGGIVMGIIIAWLRIKIITIDTLKYQQIPFIERKINMKKIISSPWHVALYGLIFIPLFLFFPFRSSWIDHNVLNIFSDVFIISLVLVFAIIYWRWFTKLQNELKFR